MELLSTSSNHDIHDTQLTKHVFLLPNVVNIVSTVSHGLVRAGVFQTPHPPKHSPNVFKYRLLRLLGSAVAKPRLQALRRGVLQSGGRKLEHRVRIARGS